MPFDFDPTMPLSFIVAAMGVVLTRQVWRWLTDLKVKVRAESKPYKEPDGREFSMRVSWNVRKRGIPYRRVVAASAYIYDKR